MNKRTNRSISKVWAAIGILAVLTVAAGWRTVWADSCGGHSGKNYGATKDIVDTAIEAGGFKTLVTAVEVAGLVEALRRKGPFTLFAPNDEAFAKLPEGTVDSLLKNKEQLASVLSYHVVPGKLTSSDISSMPSAKSLNGKSISIDTSAGVKVDNAKVIGADIMASNGVIHVIDAVIMP